MSAIRVRHINKHFLHLGGATYESGCKNARYGRADNKRFVIFIHDEELPVDSICTIEDGIRSHSGKVLGRGLDDTQVLDTMPERPMVSR